MTLPFIDTWATFLAFQKWTVTVASRTSPFEVDILARENKWMNIFSQKLHVNNLSLGILLIRPDTYKETHNCNENNRVYLHWLNNQLCLFLHNWEGVTIHRKYIRSQSYCTFAKHPRSNPRPDKAFRSFLVNCFLTSHSHFKFLWNHKAMISSKSSYVEFLQ